MRALERTVEDLQGDLGKATNQINRLTAAAKKPAGPIQKLTKGFARLAVAIGSVATAQKLFASGLKTVTAEAQLVSIASAFNEVAEAQAAAARIQTTYNLSAREANTQFAQILARLRPLGIELKSVEDAYGGLATAIKIAGLDAAGAGALFTQVAQGLGSGTVQAEELNTVLDQSPLIVVALAEELGVAAGQIKKLASDGGVSSESLLKALIRVKDEGVGQLAASLDTPAEKIKFFQNVTEDVADKLTRGAIFDLTEATRDFAVALADLAPVFEFVGATGQVILRGLIATMRFGIEVAAGFGRALENLKSGNFKALIEPDTTGIERLQDIWKDLTAPLEGKLPTPPARTPRDRPDPKNYGDSSGAGKAAADAQKLADQTAERLLSAEKLVTAAQREGELLNANSEFEKAQIESKNAIFEIAEKYGELAAKSLSDEETNLLVQAQGLEVQNERVALAEKEAKAIKSATQPLLDQQQFLQEAITLGREEAIIRQEIRQAMEGLPEAERARVESLIRGNQALEDQLSTMDQMKELAGSISDTIENGLVNALGTAVEGLITGAEDLDESLKKILQGVLKDIANQMIKAGISSLFQSIGGGGGGGIFGGLFRAEGGPVAGGQSYIVGEKGPEIFTPGLTGNITSNSDSKVAMANYSGGNASSAAAMAPMAANVTYSGPTLNFNGDDYIPRSEASNLVAAGAKQGQDMAMKRLQNSRSQRSRLGM